jgi:pimeloyl-ACP methyl ester carboxylesterase
MELMPHEAVSGRTIRLADGRTLGYSEYGAAGGRPLLMMHGTPGSRRMFRPAHRDAERLGLRLICPERPGCGLSSPRLGATLDDVAADTEALLDHLGLGPVAVLGVSGGAPHALALVHRLGGRVVRLMLVSPLGPVGDEALRFRLHYGHRLFFLGLGRRPHLARLLASLVARGFVAHPFLGQRLFARLLGPPDRDTLSRPGRPEHVVADVAECLRQGTVGVLGDLARFVTPWRLDLARIAAQTTIWHGTADVVVPMAAVEAIASRLPQARLELVPGGGHFWIYDNIARVLAEAAPPEASSTPNSTRPVAGGPSVA